MRQLWPETWEPLAIFQNTDPIVFVLFISLLFELLYHRGHQRKYIYRINLKSVSLWDSYGLKQRNPLQSFKSPTSLY